MWGCSAAIGAELFGYLGEGLRIGRDVPERLFERAVAEITAEQQQVVGDGRSLLAPLGDQARRQGVAKIMDAGMGAVAADNEIGGESTKYGMNRALTQLISAPSDKQTIGKGGAPLTCRLVPA